MKLSYDFLFYSIMTVISYSSFRGEYWFPDMAGGAGSCSKIYN